jgi:disulfide bond formation protein DsbB
MIKKDYMWVIILPSSALLIGAFYLQFVVGLKPCWLCILQRWPHFIAIVVFGLSFLFPKWQKSLWVTTALLTGSSGVIAGYHMGVEAGLWMASCDSPVLGTGKFASQLMDTTLTPACSVVQWWFLGLSLATWNAIISITGCIGSLLIIRKI